MKEVREAKNIKTEIGVGSVVKEKGGGMEENIRERIIRRVNNEVKVYVQDVVGKKKLLVKLKDEKKREIGYF